MLYSVLLQWIDNYSFLNIFRYLTFRSGCSILTSLLICFVFGNRIIMWLRKQQQEGQPIRECGPASHLVTKKGTPTMGGVMLLLAVGVSTLLWADLKNPYIWIVFLVTGGFGFIGFMDDYLKVTKRNSKGLPGKVKILGQTMISVLAILWVQYVSPSVSANSLSLPFAKNTAIDLGYFYLPFMLVVIVGASNAVNLTDGLDGLAIVPIMITAACFALISYLVGHVVFANYLHITHIPKAGELAIFCAAAVGAGLGFLWFNAPPARVFMGDTGSLAFGGALGSISVITKHEIVLAIIGGLFVMEAVSVIIQVYYYKWTGKRFFGMAPIHHHFEKKGWSEPTIVIRFWIIAVIFALIGLSTLKLR